MAIGTYISIIALSASGLNPLTRLNGYKNKTHVYAVYKKPSSELKTHIE